VNTESLIFGIVLLTVLSTLLVLITVTFRRALQDVLRNTDRMNERDSRRLQGVLDRFQAIKWEDLLAMRVTEEEAQTGGFFTPGEDDGEEGGQEQPNERWGIVSAMKLREERAANEETLIMEDFDERGNPR